MAQQAWEMLVKSDTRVSLAAFLGIQVSCPFAREMYVYGSLQNPGCWLESI